MRSTISFTMIWQLGKSTVLLTLSASERHWPRLLTPYERLCHQDPGLQVHVLEMASICQAQLVIGDPVVCAIYFNKFLCIILSVLCSRTHSTFKPCCFINYSKCIEFKHLPLAKVSSNMPETITLATNLLALDTSLAAPVHSSSPTHQNHLRVQQLSPFWCSFLTHFSAVWHMALKERFLQMHAALEGRLRQHWPIPP